MSENSTSTPKNHHDQQQQHQPKSNSHVRTIFTISLIVLSIMIIFSDKSKSSSPPVSENDLLSSSSPSQKTTTNPPSSPSTTSSKTDGTEENNNNNDDLTKPKFHFIYFDGNEDADDGDNSQISIDDEDDAAKQKREQYNRLQKQKESSIQDDSVPIFDFVYSTENGDDNSDIIKSDRRNRRRRKWILIDRKQATNWFRTRFGDRWKCGIFNDQNSISSNDGDERYDDDVALFGDKSPIAVPSEIKTEFLNSKSHENFKLLVQEFGKELTAYHQQQVGTNRISSSSKQSVMINQGEDFDFAGSVANMIIPWYYDEKNQNNNKHQDASTGPAFISNSNTRKFMFYSYCSPRSGYAKPVYFVSYKAVGAAIENNNIQQQRNSVGMMKIPKNTFRLRSVTEPALGMGCLRKLMILDGNAPSLERAMMKRCYLPLTTTTRNKNKNSSQPFVVGLGHSHTRYLLAMLCMLANNSWCQEFSGIKNGRVPHYPGDAFDSFFLRPDVISSSSSTTRRNNNNNVIRDNFQQQDNSDEETNNENKKNAKSHQENSLLSLSNHESTILNPQLRLQPLRLAYTASYYDQRLSFLKFITWIQAHVTQKKNYISPGLKNLLNKRQEKDKTDWTTTLGEDQDESENDKFDEELIDWIRNDKESVFSFGDNAKVAKFVSPTHFVMSRGEWDMLYLNPNPVSMMKQITRAIKVISKSFPQAKIIFQLPQKHYPVAAAASKRRGDKKSLRNAVWRNTCSSDERIAVVRHACVCAAWRNHLKNNEDDNQKNLESSSSSSSSLILFDTDELTRSEFGKTFVDSTGHHYIDEALEVMAMEIKRIVERDSVAEEYMKRTKEYLKRVGERSCKRVEEAGKQFEQDEKNNQNNLNKICSCHRDPPADPGFCKQVRVLPRSVG